MKTVTMMLAGCTVLAPGVCVSQSAVVSPSPPPAALSALMVINSDAE